MKTPVLFLIFNRPQLTKKVLHEIQQAKPPRLYIASDGPRENKLGENILVQEARNAVLSNITWDCQVKTLFRDKNLGCKFAVSDAISWFFQNEDAGIILEDDYLPDQSFFSFCEELLAKYKDDTRIIQISGTNLLGEYDLCKCSYFFTIYGGVWGWATWKRAWQLYDIGMKTWPLVKNENYLKNAIRNPKDLKIRTKEFDMTYHNLIDTWDYQWIYTRLVNNMLSIIPKVNLIKNIGLNTAATHTGVGMQSLSRTRRTMPFPLKHPGIVIPDSLFEQKAFLKKMQSKSFINRLKRIGEKIWAKK